MSLAGASALAASNDPVEGLRQALSEDRKKDASRKMVLEDKIAALGELEDMARAMVLQEWSHKDLDTINNIDPKEEALKNVRRALRVKLAEKIEALVEKNSKSPNPVTRLATASVIGGFELASRRELSQFIPERVTKLAPSLLLLARDSDARVRQAAVRSLSAIDTDPKKAVPAMAQLLRSENVTDRRVAAESLGNFMSELGRRLLSGAGGLGVYERAMAAAELVPPAAGAGIGDADAEVRRLSIDAILQTMSALKELMPRKDEKTLRALTPEMAKKDRADLKKLLPVMRALADQLPAIVGASRDKDVATRLAVARTLEAIAFARREYLDYDKSLLRIGESDVGGARGRTTPAQPVALAARGEAVLALADAPDDPLLDGLRKAVSSLVRLAADANDEVRLAALSALDLLEDEATPAVDALVKALSDQNPFARWSAARSLSKIEAAGTAERAVPKLVPLLAETDVDVRIAGIQALSHYGSAAKGAVPALSRAALEGDTDSRVAALKALTSIGTDARGSIPDLISILADGDPRVRRAAAETLGRFGPLAKDASKALQKLLRDAEPAVRLAAGEALLRITK
jgi:HEAT repeat protein